MQTMKFPRCPLPDVALVTQHLPADHIADVREHTCKCLLEAKLRDKVVPAITAGSRGMGGFVELLGDIADAVKAAEGESFLIPMMGSHSGATPEGQTDTLHRPDATEEAVGVPVCATMETITLGTADNGAVVHPDRHARVPTILFDHLDLLIVDEIGKDITGSSMDLNVRAIIIIRRRHVARGNAVKDPQVIRGFIQPDVRLAAGNRGSYERAL